MDILSVGFTFLGADSSR